MEINQELVAHTYVELDALLHKYFKFTVAKDGLPPLHMNWDAYAKLDKNSNLLLLIARGSNPDDVLGFVMYHVYEHLHHIGVVVAACDILAVDLDKRGKGIAKALMEHAEPVLKGRGVQLVTHQFRTCYNVEPLFPKMGYKLLEQAYMKELV